MKGWREREEGTEAASWWAVGGAAKGWSAGEEGKRGGVATEVGRTSQQKGQRRQQKESCTPVARVLNGASMSLTGQRSSNPSAVAFCCHRRNKITAFLYSLLLKFRAMES